VAHELTIIALSLWMIVFVGLTSVVYVLVSMWKENRFGWPLRGIIWFAVAIVGSCAVDNEFTGVAKVSTRDLQDNELGTSEVRLEGKRIQVEPF
jgi:hypothetical protein